MNRLLDPKFKYRPSFATNVRKTFERFRKQQQQRADEQAAKVKPLPQRKEKA